MSAVNDFAIRIATVNGTGSASANGLLMQAMFRMGIPVTGKNIFPSNIQGLPTWYEIRVSKDGYTARPPQIDLIVALNPATYAKDMTTVRGGGYVLYDSSWPMDASLIRADVSLLGIPFGRMCIEAFERDQDRPLLRNIAYLGALAALLSVELPVIEQLLVERYGKKQALLGDNRRAFHLGYDYATQHLPCPLPLHAARMDKTDGAVLIDGNTACALGALYAGATVGAWYPITPSTSLMEAFKRLCREYRVEADTGLNKYCILQAEDELAAAGIVVGAGWMGARAFTNTSGPGISLMQEFVGFAYYAEIPAVFFDVQRVGPSTGMPTRTQQSDLMSLAYASHGDTKHIILFPADPKEAFELSVTAFDLADRFQTPVFVASDLDIGMNDWMVPRLAWDDAYRPDRGKVLDAAALDQVKKFSRYLDVDGDGITARTLPGIGGKGAWFARGSSHDKHAAYTEDSDAAMEVIGRIARKVAGAATVSPQPVALTRPGADVGIITIGSCDAPVREAIDRLAELGHAVDYLRIRAFPFADSVRPFVERHRVTFVVEQNRDAQLRALIAAETGAPRDAMVPITDNSGLPLTAPRVVSAVVAHLAEGSS